MKLVHPWMKKTRNPLITFHNDTLAHAIRQVHKNDSATFFIFILKDVRSFWWRRFKQRKRKGEERTPFPIRLFSSNAIPYASVTLPRRPLSPMSRSLFPSLCFFVSSFSAVFFFFHPSLLLLFVSPLRLTPMSIFPYRLICKEAPFPSLCTVLLYLSFPSIRAFLYTTNQPIFPFPRLPFLLFLSL